MWKKANRDKLVIQLYCRAVDSLSATMNKTFHVFTLKYNVLLVSLPSYQIERSLLDSRLSILARLEIPSASVPVRLLLSPTLRQMSCASVSISCVSRRCSLIGPLLLLETASAIIIGSTLQADVTSVMTRRQACGGSLIRALFWRNIIFPGTSVLFCYISV